MRKGLFGAMLLAGALVAAPALADVKAGVDAWSAGNFSAAVAQWRPLADKGDADAQFNMGQAYKLGRGVSADPKIALSWFEKAAAQGHEQAQSNAGLLLYNAGRKPAAMRWIRMASDRGDPRAQYILGIEYFNATTLQKDWPRAYALMTRAASAGLPPAAAALEQMNQHIPAADRQRGIALARRDAAPKAPRAAGTQQAMAKAAPAKAVAAKPPVKVAQASAAAGKWRVQLGAFGSPAIAQTQWSTISRKVGALSGMQPIYEPAGKFTRLRVGPLSNRAAADKLCAAAKASGQACFAVAP